MCNTKRQTEEREPSNRFEKKGVITYSINKHFVCDGADEQKEEDRGKKKVV